LKKRLIRVSTPRFVAGFVVEYINNEWVVTQCAPILKWIKDYPLSKVKTLFDIKLYNYKVFKIDG